MNLDNLIHWRLVGKPDVFTETWDGDKWLVIDSDRPYRAGFYQTVQLARPIQNVILMARASLWTANGGLMIRAGIDPHGGTDPTASSITWGGWEGPDNGWFGEPPRVIGVSRALLNTSKVTVFLEGTCRWAVKNVCRFRDVRLEVEYAEEPEPPPPPEPSPEPEPEYPPGDPRRWAVERMREIQAQIAALCETSQTLLEEVRDLAALFGLTEEEQARAQAWIEEYNRGVEV